jgi:rare lipoprotein A
MSPFLTGALCGIAALLGLVGGRLAVGNTNVEPAGAPRVVAASPFETIPTAVIESEKEEVEYESELFYRVCRVTAYCDRGLTAAGVPSGVGQCAAPADIPFGSRIYIRALDRTFLVTDRTAKRFRRNTVDLFIPDCRECKTFGRQYLECEIAIPTKTVRYGSPRLHAVLAAAH